MALRATVCFLLATSASALMAVPHPRLNSGRAPVPAMGLFDALSSAFANDETLGARENAGLSKDVTKRTVTWVAPGGQTKLSTVVAGQRFRDIARSSGIPIKYDCQEGTCKTCEAMVGNSRAKLCVARMPNKDVTVKYNIRN